MIKVEHIDVWGFEHAIRGMRNPMNSWEKSDSKIVYNHSNNWAIDLGENDLNLMTRLYSAGPEHRKYMRQIMISMDITAPLYWWKEMDTYKVGTVSDSCSTMHKITAKEFELDDFSHDSLETLTDDDYNYAWQDWFGIITCLNYFRDKYNETKDKRYWRQLIEKLPSSYNQKRTVTMNYENAVNIIKQRAGHKLTEWCDFCIILRLQLPFLATIIELGENVEEG